MQNVAVTAAAPHVLEFARGGLQGKNSMNDLVERLEAMLAQGQDNMLLRFSLGKAYTEDEQFSKAVPHLRAALVFDPRYSVAWKWLGKALLGSGETDSARQAWEQGSLVAQQRGDQQLVKELAVLIKRLNRPQP